MPWSAYYGATVWQNSPATATPLQAAVMTNWDAIYTESSLSIGPDEIATGFVLSGLLCTGAAGQAALTVPLGTAYLVQSDGTLRQRKVSATTKTTATTSSTYYLDLNPDGTWSWGTSHSIETNYLPICQVTTDSSGNILVVTDERARVATLFPGLFGTDGKGALAFGATTYWGAQPYLSIDLLGSAVGTGVVTPAAPSGTVVSGSGLGTGVYKYVVTYLSPNGKSAQSLALALTTTTGNQEINLTAIPTGPNGVTERNIYRTVVGGSTYDLLTTLADNTTTTYTDTTADASLTTSTHPPVHPTMGADRWLNSSSTLLAAIYGDGAVYFDSGNITSDGAGNLTMGNLTMGNLVASGAVTANTVTLKPTASNDAIILYDSAGAVTAAIGNSSTGFYLYDEVGGGFAIQNLTKSGITIYGALQSLGGQASTGSFGAPVIVAQRINQHVTATSNTSILSWTPTATGLYRFSIFFTINNGTNNQKPSITVFYTDPNTNSSISQAPTAFVSTGIQAINGTNIVSNGSIACFPLPVYCKTGLAIGVNYQDGANTPNDYVTVIVERMD